MMGVPSPDIIKACFALGMMVSINQRLDAETFLRDRRRGKWLQGGVRRRGRSGGNETEEDDARARHRSRPSSPS